MVPKEVRDYIHSNGIETLYNNCKKYFEKVDYWSDQFVSGDLLDEFQLSKALTELTGSFQRCHIIGMTLESYKTNKELDYKILAYKKAEADGKKVTVSQIEEEARASTHQFRTYRSDFNCYSEAAEKGIITCQALLKRQSVEKGAKGIDFQGDMSNPAVVERQTPTTQPKDISWT